MSTDSVTTSCILTGSNCTTSTTTPQFIDTSHCLCALGPSRASADSTTELWRCVGNASDDSVASGTSGKWWYTLNANSNLEGFSEPMNSAMNPPDVGKAYMLVDDGDGGSNYVEFNGTGVDEGCTARNDTQASTHYYGIRQGASNSTGAVSTATPSNASSPQGGQSLTTALPTPTVTPLPSSAPKQANASSRKEGALKTGLLLGLCLSSMASFFQR